MPDPTSPYELKFENREGYLYAYLKADTMTGDDAQSYLREVMDEAHRLRQKRVMIDRDVPVMLPAGPLFFVTRDFVDMIRGMRVVYVNRYADLDDDMKFAITIATNRGAQYTVLRTVEAAEKWLLG
jgi:hypothetical protein